MDDDEYDNASTDDNGTDDDTTGDDEKTEDDDSDDDTETGDPIQTGKGDENFFASKEGISIIVGAFLLIIIMIVFVLRKRDTREKIDAPGSDGETGDNLPGVDGETGDNLPGVDGEISEDSEIKSEENGNNE